MFTLIHFNTPFRSCFTKFGGIDKQIQSFISSNLGASKQGGASVGDQKDICDECDVEDDSDSDDKENDEKYHKNEKKKELIRSDHLWAYLLDGENVPNLLKLVQFAYAIPASNAYCESVFSHMKYLWDNNRNRRTRDLVGAELKIKMNSYCTCTQFYDYLLNKPDILKQIRSSEKYSHVAKVPRNSQ